MFLMALDNGKLITLNTSYIEKIEVNVNIFNEQRLAFNSVFTDKNGKVYKGIGIDEDMISGIYKIYSKSQLEILLIELITEFLNSGISVANLDNILFKKLYLKTDNLSVKEVNRITNLIQ
ncbi:MAG: hypothetical protein IJ086_13545 [Clostridium sp.]|nr:hypothetical protein [Clostridium sp.]MBQ8999693.1 hypothetical protein [Clostridium sp.]